MNFEHFIITRYNLVKEDWLEDVEKRKVLDDSWTKSRNDLFLKFCLPSVVNQNCLQFKWLIFFQENSNESVQPVLNKLDKYDFVEAVFLESYEEFQLRLPSIIESYLKKNTTWVLTTRLDNDDALHSDFTLKLQNASKNVHEPTVLHFPAGLLLDMAFKPRLASAHYPMNQFLSFMEPNISSEIITVLGREHDRWGKEFKVQEILLNDAWLQITHSRNLSNHHFGHPTYSHRLNFFGFEQPKFPLAYNWRIVLNKFLKFKR
jgi:hypothetical protein